MSTGIGSSWVTGLDDDVFLVWKDFKYWKIGQVGKVLKRIIITINWNLYHFNEEFRIKFDKWWDG
jgi:hypothetical protein